jgi:hypothetical protein
MEVLRVGRNTHAAGKLEVQFCPLAKISSIMHGALSNSGDARPWRAKLLKMPRRPSRIAGPVPVDPDSEGHVSQRIKLCPVPDTG